MASGEGGGGEVDEQQQFIAAVGRTAVSLGESGGNSAMLGNEFKNVLAAVEKERVVDYATGTEAMNKIAQQAEEIRARGGQP